jgi:hypothetical protein
MTQDRIREMLAEAYRGWSLGRSELLDWLLRPNAAGGERWEITDFVGGARRTLCEDVVRGLFDGCVPRHWEIAGLTVEHTSQEGARVLVTGRCRCRPPGGWEMTSLPFAHRWLLDGERAVEVVSCFDHRRLRRLPAPKGMAAA